MVDFLWLRLRRFRPRSSVRGSGERLRGYPHLVPLREVLAYVLLALVAEERHDRSEAGVRLFDKFRGDEVGAGAWADEEAVGFGEAAHLLDGFFGVHGEGVVHEPFVALEDAGYEAVGDALDQVFPDLPAQQRRRLRRLHRKQPDGRVDLPESLPHPDEGASGAHAHNQGVRGLVFGELRQDLGAQDHAVLLHVPLRLELRRAEVARLPAELLGFGERGVYVEVADLHHLGAERAAYGETFSAHPLGHHDEHAVALDGGDHREGVAGVAGGGLDDGVAPPEEPFAFGAFDHVLRDARLDRSRRVEVLQLGPDPLDAHQRRVADAVEHAGGGPPHADDRLVGLHHARILFIAGSKSGSSATVAGWRSPKYSISTLLPTSAC